MSIFAALLLAIIPRGQEVQVCTAIEDNRIWRIEHFDPNTGEAVWEVRMRQLIFWGEYPGEHICFVREWQIVPDDDQPIFDSSGAQPFVAYRGRIVKANCIMQTDTQHDPEIENRGRFPDCERKKLK